MKSALIWGARIAGAAGAALIVIAFAVRLSGSWSLAGLQVGTLLQGGMAAVLIACLAYLAVLVEQRP